MAVPFEDQNRQRRSQYFEGGKSGDDKIIRPWSKPLPGQRTGHHRDQRRAPIDGELGNWKAAEVENGSVNRGCPPTAANQQPNTNFSLR